MTQRTMFDEPEPPPGTESVGAAMMVRATAEMQVAVESTMSGIMTEYLTKSEPNIVAEQIIKPEHLELVKDRSDWFEVLMMVWHVKMSPEELKDWKRFQEKEGKR